MSAQPAANLVLASASPRRRELLAQLGLPFEVFAPQVDETPGAGEVDTQQLVKRLALEKATAGRRAFPQARVIAADTLVALPGRLALGKPSGAEEARRMLRSLSGRQHEVSTGVCVSSPERSVVRAVTTRVSMRTISDAEIDWYVGTGEPLDKAGAYAIQGRGAIFVSAIEGSWSNVVGLPMAELTEMLADIGVALPWLA
jgi:septum formation protein